MSMTEGMSSEQQRKRASGDAGGARAPRKPAAGKQTRAEGGPEGAEAERAPASGNEGSQRADDWGMTPDLESAMGLSAGGGDAQASEPISDKEPEGATPKRPAQTQSVTTGGSSETPTLGARSPEAVTDAPRASYLVPFDRSPLAAPGERIICVAEFTGGTASEYEIVYSCVNGHFRTAAGPATVTIQGLTSGNVNFFVPSPWNGTDAVSVTMKLRKKSDSSIAHTETWNFGKKTYYPTTMTQREGTGEVNLPGVYRYDIGPARSSGSAPFYEHQTILEWFDNWSIGNIQPSDIKESYRTAHNLTSVSAITSHVLGPYAGNNGTFTVNASDRIADQHGGHPNVETLASNLVTPKDIEVALPQTYEAQPGTALGRYMVTRIRKTDGSWKVKKAPR
ncbi:MAG: hypothetical protein R3B48_26600 [Kofleriaceae bacterium]